jgi:hypothetical protein
MIWAAAASACVQAASLSIAQAEPVSSGSAKVFVCAPSVTGDSSVPNSGQYQYDCKMAMATCAAFGIVGAYGPSGQSGGFSRCLRKAVAADEREYEAWLNKQAWAAAHPVFPMDQLAALPMSRVLRDARYSAILPQGASITELMRSPGIGGGAYPVLKAGTLVKVGKMLPVDDPERPTLSRDFDFVAVVNADGSPVRKKNGEIETAFVSTDVYNCDDCHSLDNVGDLNAPTALQEGEDALRQGDGLWAMLSQPDCMQTDKCRNHAYGFAALNYSMALANGAGGARAEELNSRIAESCAKLVGITVRLFNDVTGKPICPELVEYKP